MNRNLSRQKSADHSLSKTCHELTNDRPDDRYEQNYHSDDGHYHDQVKRGFEAFSLPLLDSSSAFDCEQCGENERVRNDHDQMQKAVNNLPIWQQCLQLTLAYVYDTDNDESDRNEEGDKTHQEGDRGSLSGLKVSSSSPKQVAIRPPFLCMAD